MFEIYLLIIRFSDKDKNENDEKFELNKQRKEHRDQLITVDFLIKIRTIVREEVIKLIPSLRFVFLRRCSPNEKSNSLVESHRDDSLFSLSFFFVSFGIKWTAWKESQPIRSMLVDRFSGPKSIDRIKERKEVKVLLITWTISRNRNH